MFEVRVERVFCAAHALVIGGARETLHGHNWRVRVTIAGPALDADGLLVDFHAVERLLDEIIGPMHNANLHDVPPFDTVSPSAERVAEQIGARMRAGVDVLTMATSPRPRVVSVEVTEAPCCVATWRANA
jgi:6-pyruvoyltetrahydropterin/6-carboxytetrahydropterin synthase